MKCLRRRPGCIAGGQKKVCFSSLLYQLTVYMVCLIKSFWAVVKPGSFMVTDIKLQYLLLLSVEDNGLELCVRAGNRSTIHNSTKQQNDYLISISCPLVYAACLCFIIGN